jgi:hypothetical protein
LGHGDSTEVVGALNLANCLPGFESIRSALDSRAQPLYTDQREKPGSAGLLMIRVKIEGAEVTGIAAGNGLR